jgi:hypothetical protein
MAPLRAAIARAVRPHQQRRTLHVELAAASLRSQLYRRNAIRAERTRDDGSWEIDVELEAAELAKLDGASGVHVLEPAMRLVTRGEAA